jgi:hypothetical protein
MPECRCRTDKVDCRCKCQCRTNFFPGSGIYVEGYIRVHHQQCGSKIVFITSDNSLERKGYPLPTLAGCGHEGVFISTVNSLDVRVYPFPPPAGCGRGVPFHSQQYKQYKSNGVSLSTTSSVHRFLSQKCHDSLPMALAMYVARIKIMRARE